MATKASKVPIKPNIKKEPEMAKEYLKRLDLFCGGLITYRDDMVNTDMFHTVPQKKFFEDAYMLLKSYKIHITDSNDHYKRVDIPTDTGIKATYPDRDTALRISGIFKQWSYYRATHTEKESLKKEYTKSYWRFVKFEAPDWFDSYCVYIEKDCTSDKKLYGQRREKLKNVVYELQNLSDGNGKALFLHMPPRVGKTLLMIRFAAWHTGRNPLGSNLYVTYKESVGTTFLNGFREIIEDSYTFKHQEVFPYNSVVASDAKNNKVWLNKKGTYATLSAKGIDSGLNGEYDCADLFIADDVLSGIDEVLNPDVLANRKFIFENNAMSRVKESAIMVFMGTLWDENDIYSTQWNFYENNPEGQKTPHKRILVPALDPDTDESNFDYPSGTGFSTDRYRSIRAKFEENDDLASWFCQYQQDPRSRNGSLFMPNGVKTYDGTLPDEEPLKVITACDIALGGEDYLSMPVAYVYEDGRVFIPDVIFDNSEKHITMPRVVECMYKHRVTNAFFEANAGGEAYAEDVERLLKEQYGYKVNVTSKYAQQMIDVPGRKANPKTDARKDQRIFNNAEQIRHFYYLEPGQRTMEYRKFMNNLFAFTMNNRNRHKHDDAPDSLAMLSVFVNNGSGVKTQMRYIGRRH